MDIRKTLEELDLLYQEGLYDKLESFLLSKMEDAKEDKDLGSVITLANELLGYYRTTGRHRDSLALCDYLISLMRQTGLSETESYATTLLNIANAYREAGRTNQSLEYYDDVLKIYKNKIPEHDLRYAALCNNMSLAYNDKKDYKAASELLLKALEILDQNEGTEEEQAITNTNLAISLIRLDNLTDALAYLEKSLSIFEKIQGPKDFHHSSALSAMAELHFRLENYEKSLEYFQRSLAEIASSIGENSYYAMTCNNISLVYDKLGNREQKEKYQAMAEEIYHRLGKGQ